MENKEFKTLMDNLRGLVKINLKDRPSNAVVCPTCNGLGLYEEINDESRYLVKCSCNNGVVYKCKHCGKLNKYDFCDCKATKDERRLQEEKKEQEEKEKAIKNGVLDIREYENMVVYDDNVYDKDDLEYYVREHIIRGYDIDRYVYGTDKEEGYITCDLKEYFEEKFDGNGYEDMADYFDFDDDLFKKAEDCIEKWLDNHKSSNTIYFQNRNIIVDIQPLIDDIKKELSEEDER
ncbi:MAG: hypothetical protein ACRC1T_09390 [Clostridium chrysemydis]|uniref:hypothetical protein n=1 Tax=Clostridium chrysemydis TaxID=2665504 RepID=UPI003F37F016